MLFGRSVIHWIFTVFLAVCIFVLARYFIPLLFGLIGVGLPDQIATILALLCAVGFFYGGYVYRRPIVPP